MKTKWIVGLVVLVVAGIASGGEWSGNALWFDGVDDYVSIPDFSLSSQQLTVEAWVQVDEFRQYGKIVDFGGYGLGTRFTLQVNSSGFKFNLDGTASTCVSVSDTSWHHLAATWRSTGDIHLYLDGLLATSNTYAVEELVIAAESKHHLGKRFRHYASPPDRWDYFSGAIDEIRIWNVVRTPEQIAANYDRLVDPQLAGLVAYWRFDENTGTLCQDSTNSSMYGVLGGDGYGTDLPMRIDSGAPIIPEPATLSLVALAGLAMLRRKRS